MLSIRFSKVGKKKQPTFRLIVTEKTRDPWGKHLEILGWKNPRTKETVLKADRIKYWIEKGAQPTDTVHNLLIDEKIIEDKKRRVVTISKTRQTKIDAAKPVPPAPEPAPAAAPAAPEAPAAPAEEPAK